MGRRTLGKIRHDFDLRNHYFELKALPAPLGDEPFEKRQPLEVEVGSGKGLFIHTAAAAQPTHNFLGIEIASNYAKFAAAQLAKHELSNAAMVYGDGIELFANHLTSGQVKTVHVYFPDPWWKRRHRKRRIMNEKFLQLVESRLKIGGKLHFWTDVQEYFDLSLKLIADVTTFEGPIGVPEKHPDHDFDYRTHFERRMRQHNEPIYRSEFKKVA
ncbi:MAG: tRNA (guanosine(46)-N7)-methyltransferase TrmB [Pirellulaceae bacterium]